ACTILISVMPAWPRPLTSASRATGAEITWANEPNVAISVLASGLSRDGAARETARPPTIHSPTAHRRPPRENARAGARDGHDKAGAVRHDGFDFRASFRAGNSQAIRGLFELLPPSIGSRMTEPRYFAIGV